MVALPRLVVAAPASGHGKTTVATGLMAALRRAGHVVSGHKVGPDYIDPGYHALATGRPGRNLDPHLCGEDLLEPLLLHGAAGADLAVIEGVMGLFDGRLGTDGEASTAQVAALTRTPVVMVVDISHASRTIAALVHGLTTWNASVDVVGVILNKAGSPRHAAEVVRALEPSGLPILGVLHRDDGIEAPSRHLGLVPAAERPDATAALDRLADQVAASVDLERVVALARTAPDLSAPAWDPSTQVTPVPGKPVVAVAGGRAFTFRYAETTELLEAAGCEIAIVDPTTDEKLPDGTRALYLGGGFPEVHAGELGANESLRQEVRAKVRAGLPTVAECAGLLYLTRAVDGQPMTGVLDVDAVMAPRLTLAYRTATPSTDHLIGRAGETVTGHEFHRTVLTTALPAPAWSWADGVDGTATPTLSAGYLHTHWAGHPQLAARFAAAAAGVEADQPARERQVVVREKQGPDLRHHGDVEATPGLLDLAVNVYDAPRPAWLETALAHGIAESHRYPDATEARKALAARHDRSPDDVLPTAGAAEAFGLVARLRPWRHPVVVHPQFTEPDVALEQAGHRPIHAIVTPPFEKLPEIPASADLVIIGNPTNPTGVRHPAAAIRALTRPGRLVVVDEAFCDDGVESLADQAIEGLVVVRSLTKLWSLPGIRAGYLLGPADVVADLAAAQTPWSVSAPAIAAMVATSTPEAAAEAKRRVAELAAWRDHLVAGLHAKGVETIASSAPFVLAHVGEGVHARLRAAGIAVRRADTFPGLDDTWVRIAVRPPEVTRQLLDSL